MFTRQICIDLEAYGQRARAAYLRKFRGIIPRVSHVNFDTRMQELGLAPDFSSYQDLINSHVTMPSPTRGRYWAKKRVSARRFFRRIDRWLGKCGASAKIVEAYKSDG